MTIQQIQYVVEVYRSGSISKAAQKLFVAQPNLSNAIRSMEEDLGFALFTRSSKGVKPTEKGMQVLTQAGQILDAYHKMMQAGVYDNFHQLRVAGVGYRPVCESFSELCGERQCADGMDCSYMILDTAAALDNIRISQLDLVLAFVQPEELAAFTRRCEGDNLTLTVLGDLPIVVQLSASYANPESFDSKTCPLVESRDFSVLDIPGVNGRFAENTAGVIHVSDWGMRESLIARNVGFGLGYGLPKEQEQALGIQSIPIDGLHGVLVAVERTNQQRSAYCSRLLEILQKKLQNI